MEDILAKLKETHWINVYISDNPKAPICSIEFVDKQDKNKRCKYPIWRDKEKPQYGYVGNMDNGTKGSVDKHNQDKANGYQGDDLDDEPPF